MTLFFFDRHLVFKRGLIVLLCVAIVAPPQGIAVAPVFATEEINDDGEDDTPTDCECEEDCCPPPAGGSAPVDGECPSDTPAPIRLSRGSVIEREIDLQLPGPVFSWRHERTYDSGSPSAGRRRLDWRGDDEGPRLTVGQDGERTLYLTATNKRVFSPSTSSSDVFQAPEDYPATLVRSGSDDGEIYTLTETETGRMLIFYGFGAGVAGKDRGRLKERTNREFSMAQRTGITYAYNSDGKVSQVVTASPQLYSITYQYIASGLEAGRLSVVRVRNQQGFLVLAATYQYYNQLLNNPSVNLPPDAGSVGDLMRVYVRRRASAGFWIVRNTLYRYYRDGDTDGSAHQLKSVFESDAVQRIIDGEEGVSTAFAVLGQPSSIISKYASRTFTYYTEDFDTDAQVSTAWGSENLQSNYGGEPFSEYNLTHQYGAVKTETIGGCGGCGGGSSNVRKTYYYLNQNGGESTNPNAVVRIVVEDTEDNGEATGERQPRYRQVFGLNTNGVAIRKAFIDDPTASTLKAWCESKKFTSNLRLSEERMPSAHTQVDSNPELKQFFRPTAGSNDSSTVSSSTGLVYYYEYDSQHGGRGDFRTGTLVREGAGTGNRHYVSAYDYGDGTDAPHYLKTASYYYPERTSTRSSGVKTSYDYTFWDPDTQQQKKRVTTTLPVITTDQNGSGVATTTEAYYDRLGRMRWSKDGEGYVDYYSYHPDSGRRAFVARDVDPESEPAGAPDNIDKWLAWDDDGDGDNSYEEDAKPSRGVEANTALPTALELTTTSEYDDQGRVVKVTRPAGDEHHTRYFRFGVLRLPYVDGNGRPATPAAVVRTNDGGLRLESYTVKPSKVSTSTTSLPTSTADMVTRTVYGYDPLDSDLAHVDRYYDIAADGYYRTSYLYDGLGRRAATIQTVDPATGRVQVDVSVYDDRDRMLETRRASTDQTPSDYAAVGGSTPAAGYATLTEYEYDHGGTGNDYLTSSKRYYTTTDYIETRPQLTFRGHSRGSDITNSNPSEPFPGPYPVRDIDWLGRPIVAAVYATAPSTWPADYSSYVADNATGRYGMVKTFYDDQRRVFRAENYPGEEGTKHFLTNNYYDRRGYRVATQEPDGVARETAYDGAGRQYQTRVAATLSGATPYSGGAFDYVAPAPHPSFAAMTSGNGRVIQLQHTEYDPEIHRGALAVANHAVELNHDDTDGFSLSGGVPTGGVRTTTHHYYDAANRMETSVDYGAGSHNDGDSSWQASALPDRDTGNQTQLQSTDNRLVSHYGYDAQTGRQDLRTDPAGIRTKTFFDDLDRRSYVVENWTGFTPNGSAPSGPADENRTTGFQLNGLNQVTKLTAFNAGATPGQATQQVADYFYLDPYHASLATHTVYPDATSRTPQTNWGTPADQVRVEYHLDRSMARRQDQRGVVMEYSYDGARRTTLQAAATITTGVDDTVRAIGRTYDPFGRVTAITSYAGASDTSAVRNQISYTYDTNHGRLIETHQAHTGAVDTSTTPSVQYAYDESAPGDVYDNGLRMTETRYPAVTGGRTTYDYGANNSLSDRLNRFDSQTLEDGGLGAGNRAHTTSVAYNGVSRLVRAASDGTSTALDYSDGGGVYAGWDRFGRTVRQEWRQGSSAIDRFDYSYDFASNRLTRETPLAPPAGFGNGSVRDQTYTYDGLHRLRSSDEFTSANDRYWELDQLGNWDRVSSDGPDIGGPQQFEQTRQHNAANELTSVSNWANPTHDAAGNMTTIPQPKNPSSSYAARYDAWNRLASLDNGSAAAYEYDGLHRRTTRTEAGVAKHFYYNERWQVLTETDGAGTATAIYSYHPHYVDAIAVRMTPDADHFYLCDALASVTTVVDNETDAVVERYHYSPYGRITVLDADYAVDEDNTSDIGNEHLYTGRRTDPGTGLQINRHRYYHAALGRWVNRDPTEYEDGPNLYLYAHSTPAIITDPSGLQGHIGYCGGKRYTKNTKNCCNGELKSKGKSCDEHELIDMCKGDPGCEDDVEDLIDILRDTPPPGWFDLDRIKYGGSCVTWKLRVMEKYWDKKDDGDLQNLSCSGKRKYYHGVNPFWSEHHWVQITFPDGGQCFADDDTLGGNDHIFFDYDDEIFNNQQHSGCGCVRDNVYIPPELPPEYNFHLDPPGP